MTYTFAFRYNGQQAWVQSGVTNETLKEAADRAAYWLLVCAENGEFIHVRLVQVS